MNRIAGIKAISFDVDGTLWDFEKVMRHSLHHVLKELERMDPDAATALDVEKMIEIRDNLCPMGKMGDAWDVAYAALFLASELSAFITGETLLVSGGLPLSK